MIDAFCYWQKALIAASFIALFYNLLLCYSVNAQTIPLEELTAIDLTRIALANHDLNPNQPSSVANNIELIPTHTARNNNNNNNRGQISIKSGSGGLATATPTMVLVVTHVFASFPTPNITIMRTQIPDDSNGATTYSQTTAGQALPILYSVVSLALLLLLPFITT